jgi:hypothetical protein
VQLVLAHGLLEGLRHERAARILGHVRVGLAHQRHRRGRAGSPNCARRASDCTPLDLGLRRGALDGEGQCDGWAVDLQGDAHGLFPRGRRTAHVPGRGASVQGLALSGAGASLSSRDGRAGRETGQAGAAARRGLTVPGRRDAAGPPAHRRGALGRDPDAAPRRWSGGGRHRRDHGSSQFLDLRDESGRVQVYAEEGAGRGPTRSCWTRWTSATSSPRVASWGARGWAK